MAPIKYEEQLKEKLEKRTIQPSPEAWSNLSNRLDKQDKNNNTKLFWWLGIAASIVGVILVTIFVFDNSESKTISPTVVDVDNDKVLKDNGSSEDNTVSKQEAIVDNATETIVSNEEQPASKVEKSSEIIPPKAMISNKAIASNDLKVQKQSQEVFEIPVNNSDFEQTKLNEVVTEINKLKTENPAVTDDEIDSLLKQAEREILTNKLNILNTRTVDVNSLLQDVETDLEQSFRSKVFEALINNYETVKTAVAERNN